MLLTTCPNCAARFKVQPEQLSVRQGRVMCGRCRHVFNAFETLKRDESPEINEDVYIADTEEDDDGDATGFSPPPQPTPPPPPALTASETSVDAGPLSVPGPAWFATPEPGVPPELANVVHHVSTAALDSGAVVAVRSETKPAAKPAPLPAGAPDEINPLLHVPLALATRKPASPSRGWTFGVVAAALLLALQTVYFFRSGIVQLYPQLRPQFAAACGLVGCSLPWGRANEAIVVQTSALMEVPEQPGHALLTATLINSSSTRQDLPYLEVRLTDNANQVLVNRILPPALYLGRPVNSEESLAPNAEIFVNLHLEVGAKLGASGYALRPFYP